MNKFDALSQKIQEKLKVTSFSLANMFLSLSFVFFFFLSREAIKRQEVVVPSDYFVIFTLAFIVVIVMEKNNEQEEKFLSGKKIIPRPAKLANLISACLFAPIIFFSIICFLLSWNVVHIFATLTIGCLYLSINFSRSTPVAPKNKKGATNETKP